jgi:glutaredoxin-like YruB-family protein
MALTVTVFTKPNCPHCDQVKEYLRQEGVAYRERDVTRDPAARQELEERIRAHGVPVTVIDQEAVLGFDRYRLDDLLKAKLGPRHLPKEEG